MSKKNFPNPLTARGVLMFGVIFLAVALIGAAQTQTLQLSRAKDNCTKRYPNPQIKFDRQDSVGRVYIPVVNWSSYDNAMFRKAPDLPPCGLNANSARTWVDIYNADTNQRVYGFCAFGANSDLQKIWFKSSAKSGRVYIILRDRACQKNYRSNTLTWGLQDDCTKRYPRPKIKFDHQDADGRVYIPVINWSAYDNAMFRKAPDLPPCGLNTNSARTWVDIYDGKTNRRVYGFCALGVNSDLQKIWFKSSAKSGWVYIIIKDRACQKNYRSNTLKWPR